METVSALPVLTVRVDVDISQHSQLTKLLWTRPLASCADSSSKHSNDPANKELNRYTNIVAYDSTRVSVKPNHYNMGTDYINANFVDGYKKKNMYIAAQGPVPGSIYS